MTDRRALLLWATSRAATILAFCTYGIVVAGDINYYRTSLEHLSSRGLSRTLVEYPVAAVGALAAPWELTRHLGETTFGLTIVALALAADLLLTVVLLRSGSRTGHAAVLAWIGAVPALGPLTFARFDILPGMLVALTVLAYRRRPGVAGILLGVATSIKLSPVLMVIPLFAGTRPRRRAAAGFAAVGLVAVTFTITLGGASRLWSPLVYQEKRGLQIESVAATPAMFAWGWRPRGLRVFFAPSKAWEILGPGTHALTTMTIVGSVFLIGFLVLLWSRVLVSGGRCTFDCLVWSSLAALSGFIVVSKVFSPQYLLWLAPLAAAGLTGVSGSRVVLVRWTGVLIVVMALSQLTFPVLYTDLVRHRALVAPAVGVLGLRNVLMVGLVVVAAAQAWRSSGWASSSIDDVAQRADRRVEAPASGSRS